MLSNSFAYVITYYSPQTNLQAVDIIWLQKVLVPKILLYVAMYSFTDKALAQKIIQPANQGVIETDFTFLSPTVKFFNFFITILISQTKITLQSNSIIANTNSTSNINIIDFFTSY